MKKFIFICLFLISANIFLLAETISICSWNIQKNTSNKIIDAITNIVKNEKIDILALQEVRGAQNKNSFLENLKGKFRTKIGGDWEYFSTSEYYIKNSVSTINENYGRGTSDQNNAVFYRSDKLTAVNKSKEYKFHNFKESEFKTDKNTLQVIIFSLKKTNSKIYFINLHLPFSNVQHRVRDFDTVLRIYKNHFPKNSNKIITGDFNFSTSEIYGLLRLRQINDATVEIYKNTTLSKSKPRFASSYDHFLYNQDIKYIQERPIRLAKIDGDEIILGKRATKKYSFETFRKEISDHVPIKVVFNLP